MIDIKFLRENPDVVKENIKKKFQDHKLVLVDEVLELDAKNREAKLNGDDLRSKRNSLSSEIGNLMRQDKKDEAGNKAGWTHGRKKGRICPCRASWGA